MLCPTCKKGELVRVLIFREVKANGKNARIAFDTVRCKFCVFRDVFGDKKYKEAHDNYIGMDVTDLETAKIWAEHEKPDLKGVGQ